MKTKLTVNVLGSKALLLGLLSVCCLVFFSISSCKKSKGTNGPPVDNTAPVVTAISPLKGPGLTEVTIEGSNFSTTLSENKVTINGKEALVVEATATKLVVLVPMGAGTGPIKVQVGAKIGTGPNFEYEWVMVINTLAGDEQGFADGTGRNAKFNLPRSIAVVPDGSLYVADYNNHRIRKITAEGVVTTFAGSNLGYVNGNISVAKFAGPSAVVAGPGGVLYIGEYGALRKITADGTVSTLAGGGIDHPGFVDGQGSAARFNGIGMGGSLVMDAQGNLYGLDGGAGASISVSLRKITPGGLVSTIAGGGPVGPQGGQDDYADGQGSAAKFASYTQGMTIDAQGNFYVADYQNRCIRKVTPDGMVSTYAGVKGESASVNGTLNNARFKGPYAICSDANGNMYVSEVGGVIRKINTTTGIVTTYAGSGVNGHLDGPVMTAQFWVAEGMAFSPDGSILYFLETNGGADGVSVIRRIMLQ